MAQKQIGSDLPAEMAQVVVSEPKNTSAGRGTTGEHRQADTLSLEASGRGLLASGASVQAQGQELKGKGAAGGKKKKVKGGEISSSGQGQQEIVELSDSDKAWMQSLSGSRLDLMVGVKKLAMRRLETAGSDVYSGVLGPRALRVMEIVLEEYIRDQLRKVEKELGKGGKTAEELGKQGQTGTGRETEGKETDCKESVKMVVEMEPSGNIEKAPHQPKRKRRLDSEKAPHQAKRKRDRESPTGQSQSELRRAKHELQLSDCNDQVGKRIRPRTRPSY